MKLRELLEKNRSYRRFRESEKIDTPVLKSLIDNLRYTPSPANLQPLKFVLVNDRSTNLRIFPHLDWAGYLEDWEGPVEGERPSAYVVILGNRGISKHVDWDYGIALQTILLGATERGFGGCAIASCQREQILDILSIPDEYEIGCVVALGKPVEKVVIESVKEGNIRYWRDDQDVHHVPKRSVDDLIYTVIE